MVKVRYLIRCRCVYKDVFSLLEGLPKRIYHPECLLTHTHNNYDIVRDVVYYLSGLFWLFGRMVMM